MAKVSGKQEAAPQDCKMRAVVRFNLQRQG